MGTIDDTLPPLWRRLLWMVGIWSASVLALGAASLALRIWIGG